MNRADAEWTLDFEIKGRERERALAEAERTLQGWGLVMPPGDPLTIDFGVHDFYHIGEIEYWIVNDLTNRYCGKYLFLFEDQRCPAHYHQMKDETFFIVRGTVEMTLDGETSALNPGDVLKVEPGRKHTFAARGGPALVLEVSLPSIQGDNIFEDSRIGRNGVL